MMLVHSICRKIHARVGRCVEYDDLVGFGTTGLLEAADRFDPTVGVAFGTFAYYRVRGAVYDGMRTMGHLPRTEYEKIKAARRADELLERMGRQEAAARQPGRPTAAPSRADDLRAMYEAMADVVTVFVTSLDACIEQGAEFPDLGATPQDALGLRQLGRHLFFQRIGHIIKSSCQMPYFTPACNIGSYTQISRSQFSGGGHELP